MQRIDVEIVKLTFLLPVLLAIVLLNNCSKREKDTSSQVKVVRIGTDASFPPFEFINPETDRLEGFDIELIKAICRINSWTPMFVITSFDGIIYKLNEKKYDIVISAMTITPEREAVVSFSEPYYLTGLIIAVTMDDTLIHGIKDLKGKRVGVQKGTTAESMAEESEGLQIYPYDEVTAAFIDLANGKLDAVINDYPSSMEYISKKGVVKIVGELLSTEYYGIAVRKQDKQLLNDINEALKQLSKNDQLSELYSKWFDVPPMLESVIN